MLLIIIGILVGIITGLIVYARWNYGVLEKMGIPVDKPHFLLGNTADAYDEHNGLADIKKFRRLGSVYGVYEGRQPQIHISEPDLIRLVTSKDSEYFNSKRQIDFRDPFFNQMPDFQEYKKWKVLRSFLTPGFSAGKIKMMSTSMVSSCENWAHELKTLAKSSPEQKIEKYDLREGLFVMITDMVAQSCFSIKIDNPMDPNNHFAKIVRNAIVGDPNEMASPTAEIWALTFPILTKFLPPFVSPQGSKDFKTVFSQIMQARRKSGEKVKDIVDLCIEAMDKLDTPEYKEADVTEDSIIFQAFVFFFAGQDQISTVTASLIYYMIQNPEIEKRLYAEVDGFLKKYDGKIEHENLTELPYLLACLNESLRLAPFFTRTERVCTKDWKNEEYGLDIKEGMVVIINLWSTNRNPKFFPDPDRFNPERFLSPNKEKLHSYAFTSFGFGPRNCVGMKFAYEALLILSIGLLKHFKFHLRHDSKPVYIPGGLFFGPHLPFYFDVTVR